MKHMMFWATVVAAMTICAPVSAQSCKEKKAAEKALLELEQKQKQEEAALLHKMKMDSLREEQQKRKEATRAEEMERCIAPIPCSEEAVDTEEEYRQLGMAEHEMEMQEAMMKAIADAQQSLAQRLGGNCSFENVSPVCRRYTRDSKGTWSAYVVISVQKSNVNKL